MRVTLVRTAGWSVGVRIVASSKSAVVAEAADAESTELLSLETVDEALDNDGTAAETTLFVSAIVEEAWQAAIRRCDRLHVLRAAAMKGSASMSRSRTMSAETCADEVQVV